MSNNKTQSEMKNLKELISRKDLISITAQKTELGFKTDRFKLDTLKECIEWLNESSKNSIRILNGDLWGNDEDLKETEIKSFR